MSVNFAVADHGEWIRSDAGSLQIFDVKPLNGKRQLEHVSTRTQQSEAPEAGLPEQNLCRGEGWPGMQADAHMEGCYSSVGRVGTKCTRARAH